MRKEEQKKRGGSAADFNSRAGSAAAADFVRGPRPSIRTEI
jgi:hypothetical protein